MTSRRLKQAAVLIGFISFVIGMSRMLPDASQVNGDENDNKTTNSSFLVQAGIIASSAYALRLLVQYANDKTIKAPLTPSKPVLNEEQLQKLIEALLEYESENLVENNRYALLLKDFYAKATVNQRLFLHTKLYEDYADMFMFVRKPLDNSKDGYERDRVRAWKTMQGLLTTNNLLPADVAHYAGTFFTSEEARVAERVCKAARNGAVSAKNMNKTTVLTEYNNGLNKNKAA